MSSSASNSRAALAGALVLALAACSSPEVREAPSAGSAAKSAPTSAGQKSAAAGATGGNAAAGTATASAAGGTAGVEHPDVPPAARTDFDRAVKYMRAGNAT